MIFSSGEFVAGRFRIVRPLGMGAMGEVYEGYDTEVHDRVALKTIRADAEPSGSFSDRFRQEIRIARQITHPNVCRIFDLYRHPLTSGQSVLLLAMELLEGETLAQRIARIGRIPSSEALELAAQMANGLTAIHAMRVVHRDFKSSNVILASGSNGPARAVVTDFGLARSMTGDGDSHTQSGHVVGTPAYMSPEQLRGEKPTAASDIFALGVVLYEMLTGRRPFQGQERQWPILPPSNVISGLSPNWDKLILRCLEADAGKRFQSAADVRAAIDAEIRSGGVRDPAATTKTLVAAKRPSRQLAIYAGVCVALLLAAATWLMVLPSKERSTAELWYDRGVDALRDGSYYKASNALTRAVSLDRGFPMAHARLAEAWMELDFPDKAKEEFLIAAGPGLSSLPAVHQKYVEALRCTMTRDFPGAIAQYEAILRQTPHNESAKAYVDLGRAYERAELPQKALLAYKTATELEPQGPAAFLRLAELQSRTLDPSAANRNFGIAENLYRGVSDVEGEAEVLYQRGLALNQQQKFDEARELLEQALTKARAVNSHYQEVKTLLQLSIGHSLQGNAALAQVTAEKALAIARQDGIEGLTARGLVDLGNTFFLEARYAEAEKYFKDAEELARKSNSTRNQVRAQFALGNLDITRGNPDEGLPLLERCLEYYEKGNFGKEALQALVLIARGKRQKAAFDGAMKTFQRQNELATQAGDLFQQALAVEGMGNVLLEQEQYPAALEHYVKCQELGGKLRNRLFVSRSLENQGQTSWRLGRYAEARTAFGASRRIAEEAGDSGRPLLRAISESEAEMALSQQNFAEAIRRTQTILNGEESRKSMLAIRAQLVSGIAQMLSGEKNLGLKTCSAAADLAGGLTDRSLLSAARLVLAKAMLEAGDAPGALRMALELQKGFLTSHQWDSEWHCWLIASQASRRLGDAQNSRDHAERALAILSQLKHDWGDSNYDQYLKRKDIRGDQDQLSKLRF
jgi:tetratricopeptide (TPR) repeat protein